MAIADDWQSSIKTSGEEQKVLDSEVLTKKMSLKIRKVAGLNWDVVREDPLMLTKMKIYIAKENTEVQEDGQKPSECRLSGFS